MYRILFLILLLIVSLSGCAPQPPSTKSTETTGALGESGAGVVPQLKIDLAALPGATLTGGNPPVVVYPEQALFGPGAVLPLVGSQAILDPLAEMLKNQPGWNWEVTVRAVSAYGGDYDQSLAEERARLLERYLTNRGVAPGVLTFKPLAAEGTPVELRPLVAQELSPDSSSAEKE